MVDFSRYRYFDPRFIQFGFTILILKIAVSLIQYQTMNYDNSVTIKKKDSASEEYSSCTINLFGATVTSWISNGQEILFVSKNSKFDGKKAIRGGIPVVFPQFGPWESGPQHGFARITKWKIKDESSIGADSITFVLEDSETTRQYWNHNFRFEYTITIINENKLKMDAVITNTGESPFLFTFLLHTYFSVSDVLACEITGLTGCTYIDKVKNGKSCVDTRDKVIVSEFTDRIYINTPITQKLKNFNGTHKTREITVEKFNLPDTVVWNPWIENAKSMSDFGDDEWQKMICVEAGVVNTPTVLKPNKSYVASQILSIDENA